MKKQLPKPEALLPISAPTAGQRPGESEDSGSGTSTDIDAADDDEDATTVQRAIALAVTALPPKPQQKPPPPQPMQPQLQPPQQPLSATEQWVYKRRSNGEMTMTKLPPPPPLRKRGRGRSQRLVLSQILSETLSKKRETQPTPPVAPAAAPPPQQQQQQPQQQLFPPNRIDLNSMQLLAVRRSAGNIEEVYIRPPRRSFLHCYWERRSKLTTLVEARSFLRLPAVSPEATPLEMLVVVKASLRQVEAVYAVAEAGAPQTGYLCKWAGLCADQTTWETAQDLRNLALDPERTLEQMMFNATIASDREHAIATRKRFAEMTAEGKTELLLRRRPRPDMAALVERWASSAPTILESAGSSVRRSYVVEFLQLLAHTRSRGPFLIITKADDAAEWVSSLLALGSDLHFVDVSKLSLFERRSVLHSAFFYREDMPVWEVSVSTGHRVPAKIAGLTRFNVLVVNHTHLLEEDRKFLEAIQWELVVFDSSKDLLDAASLLTFFSRRRLLLGSVNTEDIVTLPKLRLLLTGSTSSASSQEMLRTINLCTHYIPKESSATPISFRQQRLQLQLASGLNSSSAASMPRVRVIPCALTDRERSHYSMLLNTSRELIAAKEVTPDTKRAKEFVALELLKVFNAPDISLLGLQAAISRSCKLDVLHRMLNIFDSKQGARVLIYAATLASFQCLSDFLRLRGAPFVAVMNSTYAATEVRRFNNDSATRYILMLTRPCAIQPHIIAANVFVQFDTDLGASCNIVRFCKGSMSTGSVLHLRLVAARTLEEFIFIRTLHRDSSSSMRYLTFGEIVGALSHCAKDYCFGSLPASAAPSVTQPTDSQLLAAVTGVIDPFPQGSTWTWPDPTLSSGYTADASTSGDRLPPPLFEMFLESQQHASVITPSVSQAVIADERRAFLEAVAQYGITDETWSHLSAATPLHDKTHSEFVQMANRLMPLVFGASSTMLADHQRMDLLRRIGALSLFRAKVQEARHRNNTLVFALQATALYSAASAVWTPAHDLALLEAVLAHGYDLRNFDQTSTYYPTIEPAARSEASRLLGASDALSIRSFIRKRIELLEDALLTEYELAQQTAATPDSSESAFSCFEREILELQN